MSDNHLAFVFPAFTSDYSAHPGRNMPGLEHRFNEFLSHAATLTDPSLADFNISEGPTVNDELQTQYLTYIYSCAASTLLRDTGLTPFMNAGYSMGIYAALFDAGCVSFHTGIELITNAFQSLINSPDKSDFGMATLIGLDRRDIEQLIANRSLRAEVTNQNATHSFVVSGFREDLSLLMELAMDEGALNVRAIGVSIPYHADMLHAGAIDFESRTGHLKISAPATPVISIIDQRLLTTPESIRHEITRNLYHPLNWFSTMQSMLKKGVTRFVECGPSTGLYRNARFVEGNYRFDSLNSINL